MDLPRKAKKHHATKSRKLLRGEQNLFEGGEDSE